MDLIKKLKAQIAEANSALAGLVSKAAEFDAKLAEIEDLEAQLKRAEVAEKRAAASAVPAMVPAQPKDENEGDQGFKSFAEQLRSVASATVNKHVSLDNRLVRAPSGMESGVPTDGGFVIQTDFVGELLRPVYESGQILNRCRRLTISANSNGAKFYGVDESSRATGSRWGGVQMYWISEGEAATQSKPKLKTVELDLKKLGGAWYMTDELLSDAALMQSIARQAFTDELRFTVEDSVLRGDGVGKPMGILNSPAKISIAKESGQAAGTVVLDNILKMYQRMPARSIANAVWYINSELITQLMKLVLPTGTSSGIAVFMPPTGVVGSPQYGTLLGRPVVPLEYCSAPGTEGDIIFADMGEYVVADKGGVKSDSSMHVRFLEGEQVFKITYRVHGVPTWNTALTPYKASADFKVSPWVTLAVRA